MSRSLRPGLVFPHDVFGEDPGWNEGGLGVCWDSGGESLQGMESKEPDVCGVARAQWELKKVWMDSGASP